MLKKIRYLIPLILLSSIVNAEMLSEKQYENIKSTFVAQAKIQGADVTILNVKNYTSLTEQEIKELKERRELRDDSPAEVARFILENKANMNPLALLHANDDKTTWVLPRDMEPLGFLKNDCTYVQMIGSNEDCLSLHPQLKKDLKNFMNYHDIKINEEYMSDFYFIHELTHLLPNQRILPEGTDETRIWVNEPLVHYSEIYSDLFAIVFLNNFLKYDIKSITNVVNFRNFNLTANDDLRHYSPPYIEELLKRKDWLDMKSFDEIDKLIQSIFLKVNQEHIISKKEYKLIHHENFVWCNDIDISLFKSKDELNMVIYHCKKMKKD